MAVETAAYSQQTDIQRDIAEMVRQFVDEQIIPNAERYDHEDSFPEPIVDREEAVAAVQDLGDAADRRISGSSVGRIGSRTNKCAHLTALSASPDLLGFRALSRV